MDSQTAQAPEASWSLRSSMTSMLGSLRRPSTSSGNVSGQTSSTPRLEQRQHPQQNLQRRSCPLPGEFGQPSQMPSDSSNFADDDPVENPQLVVASQPEPDPASSDAEGPLTLAARVEYSALPRGQTQDVFGLVTVQASTATVVADEAERQPTDIVCVLDVSGSMRNENKIGHVRDAVRFIISNSQPQDRVSIVTFNNSATRILRLRRMTNDGKDEANVSVMRLAANGGTSIAAGLDTGLRVLEQRQQRNKVSAILLLTDGQDGSTRHRLPALLARARQEGCSLYAFGFGRDHDASLLSEIAEHAQTPFTYVEDTENLQEVFAGAVGGLTSVVAQNVELTLTCHVPLKALHTPFPVQRDPDGRRATVRIPDIFASERRDFVVELSVPAGGGAGPETLLEASLRYSDLSRGCGVQTPVATMEATRVDEPQPELEPDEEVTAQRERVQVMQALHAATSHGDGGNFEQAQSVLAGAEQQLAMKQKKTPMSEALGVEIADAKNRLRGRSAWEGGGRAEVNDVMQMHSVQRCTNVAASSGSRMTKMSKAMYSTPTQDEWVSKSKSGSGSPR